MQAAVEELRPRHGLEWEDGSESLRCRSLDKCPASAATVVEALAAGSLVLVHSDLGYLVCCDALDRSAAHSLSSLELGTRGGVVVDPDEADRFAVVGRRARRLMTETWPGTLVLRLPRRRSLPSWAAPGELVNVVCPDAFFWRLAWSFGSPIAVASATGRGCPDAAWPCARLGDVVDLVVDGGRSPCVPATVLDLTNARPRVSSSGGMFAPQRLRRLVPDLP